MRARVLRVRVQKFPLCALYEEDKVLKKNKLKLYAYFLLSVLTPYSETLKLVLCKSFFPHSSEAVKRVSHFFTRRTTQKKHPFPPRARFSLSYKVYLFFTP